ncbi:hypothetical protein BC939DRAFT_523288, partial [Gamsiella multidivaricata]|uniref:uncharacterized protein n=1 Tax=Gamsiella multidivaricata TaxID=101098 RepID=UPI00221FD135
FSPGEYLLADPVYGTPAFCVPEYNAPAINLLDNNRLYCCLARSYAHNEHPREIRQQIRSVKDILFN